MLRPFSSRTVPFRGLDDNTGARRKFRAYDVAPILAGVEPVAIRPDIAGLRSKACAIQEEQTCA